VKHVVVSLRVSERRACKAIGQVRTVYRYVTKPNPEQEKLRNRVIAVASEYSRYGYRQVTNILNMEGIEVGKDRVYRIWREEGLKVPQKAPKRGRLFLANGSTIRHRPTHRNHVWSYDFVADRTHNGSPYKILNIVDEYSRVCLASHTARRIRSGDVIRVLAELFLKHGCPEYIRSDNGPEFIAEILKGWLGKLEVKPLYIEPGSPWENGYCESFNGKMRYELLDGEIFYTLFEAKTIIERWRVHYNTKRPHSSLGGRPPAPVTIQLAS
jgi:putative transposase